MKDRARGLPRISDAEWDVMNVLWEEHPLAAGEVASRLSTQRSWSPRTVKTLLSRLVRKGALRYTEEGRRYLYAPRVARERCIRAESRSFVERVFGGRTSPALVRMVEAAELSEQDIAELRRVLGEKSAERAGDEDDS